MKIILNFLLLTIIALKINANENVEIIQLHTTPNLDQIVLEHNEVQDNADENTQIDDEDLIEVDDTNTELQENIDQTVVYNENFLSLSNQNDIDNYLSNLKNIKSDILKKELFQLLEEVSLDYNTKKNKDIFYSIIKYFYENGNISRAYNMLSIYSFEDDQRLDYYKMIEINYLLSTFQLEKVCNIKDNLSTEVKLKNFLLEKIDIFCMVLSNNLAEAELLNTIIIESENELDENFQSLYSLINFNDVNTDELIFKTEINPNLIFLYSAMARIAEVPLDENFLKVDPKNLSIPIILNKSSPIEIRIKAATQSYINKIISIESLSALYQSVDFSSEELNNKNKTIETLSDNPELVMAYYFQLINIQIFPSERLKALIEFWNYAKENKLEKIAYALTYQIVETIEVSSDNLEFGQEIAKCYIYNKQYDKALSWIEHYEKNNQIEDKSSHARSLLKLHFNTEEEYFIEIIDSYIDKNNIEKFKNYEELKYILQISLDLEISDKISEEFTDIYDQRFLPSMFIIKNIKEAKINNNDDKFLIFSMLSIDNKNWNEIHPEHLLLILNGYISYKNGNLLKEIIIEIFEDYQIL